jgi:hypothetical protein
MKIIFFILATIYSIVATALPTIAMPDMTVDSSADTETLQLKQAIVKTVPKFSADIRGALIKTGEFKVIDVKPVNLPSNIVALQAESGLNPESSTTESAHVSKVADNKASAKIATDYYLLGEINYIGENEDSYPIKQTNNMTKQYVVEVEADFKLVRASDNTIMASFSATGRASDVKIVSTVNQLNSVWHHNIGKLVASASKDLASNVVDEMQSQFNFTVNNEEKVRKAGESVVVTDVKVYN